MDFLTIYKGQSILIPIALTEEQWAYIEKMSDGQDDLTYSVSLLVHLLLRMHINSLLDAEKPKKQRKTKKTKKNKTKKR